MCCPLSVPVSVPPVKGKPDEGKDSNVGSAPLFARRNLPSLDDVPCGSLASVTASLAILAVVTALSAIVKDVDPVTSPVCVALLVLAVFAAIAALIELANLASVTASSAIFAVVTPPSVSYTHLTLPTSDLV